jgi:hypothetical protein
MDFGQAAAVITSLKTVGEIATAMKDVKDATVFQTKAFELTREIMSAQQAAMSSMMAQQAMISEIADLKKQLADLEAWSKEKERYALVDHGCGTYTRSLKLNLANGEPPHRLCPQCFENGTKGILQSHGIYGLGREKVECLKCGKEQWLGCEKYVPDNNTARTEFDPW